MVLPLVPVAVQVSGGLAVNVTARPDEAVACAVLVLPTDSEPSKVIGPMVWLPCPTGTVSVACGAGVKVSLPA